MSTYQASCHAVIYIVRARIYFYWINWERVLSFYHQVTQYNFFLPNECEIILLPISNSYFCHSLIYSRLFTSITIFINLYMSWYSFHHFQHGNSEGYLKNLTLPKLNEPINRYLEIFSKSST